VSRIPEKLPGLRAATLCTALYAVIWISLEGALWSVILLGTAVTTVLLAHAVTRRIGGLQLPPPKLALLLATIGLILGLGSGGLTLAFMVIKTGLHAHGPEFTSEELGWVLRQIPIWSVSGLLGGLGLAMVLGSERKSG